MPTPLNREQWPFYLDSFSKHNQGQATELKIFDYLEVEHRLPLNGISLEESGAGAPKIEIMLGGASAEAQHITHTITQVQRITPYPEGRRYEGFELVDGNGIRTTLRMAAPQQLLAAP